MRTSIFLGLFTIASALKGTTVFNTSFDMDSTAIGLFFGLFLALDILDAIKNYSKKDE